MSIESRSLSIFRQPLSRSLDGEFGFAVVVNTSNERFSSKRLTVEYGMPHINSLLQLGDLMKATFDNPGLTKQLLGSQKRLEFINEVPEDYKNEYAPLDKWLVHDVESVLTSMGLPISFEQYMATQQTK